MLNRRQNKKIKTLVNFQQFREYFKIIKSNGVIMVYDIKNRDYYTLVTFLNRMKLVINNEYRPRISNNLKEFIENNYNNGGN